MELTSKIECRTRVVASLEESGEITIKAFASAEYANDRTATAEVSGAEIDPAHCDAVKAALQAVLNAAVSELGPRITKAVHKSAEVAAAHGEI